MEHLSAYEKVKLARDPRRPYFLDYVEAMCTDFSEIHGDRKFGDDPAIVTGFAFFQGKAVCLVGHQKGRDTRQKLYRNFGMPKPEGLSKGTSRDETRREVWVADPHIHRHSRRISRR